MANVTFDKKQLPQVAALGTLSACMFSYFGFKMLVPPATQAAPAAPTAGTVTGGAAGASSSAGTSSSPTDSTSSASGTSSDAVDPSALIGASAPSAMMRDPFAAAKAAPTSDKAKLGASGDSAPKALPSLAEAGAAQGGQKVDGSSALPSLAGASAGAPVTPALAAPQIVSPAAQWSVSGVICSDINPSLSLAIFRAGNVRRYVRVGEWLDNSTQLTSLDRAGVMLVRSGMRFRLALGAAPEASGAAQLQQQAPPAPMMPAPASPQLPSLPQQHAELTAPVQAHPVVTIADASQAAPIEKVGDSVQVSTLGVTTVTTGDDTAAAAVAAPQPTDANSPSSGAMDVPTFNSDLPAQMDGVGQLQTASWASQNGSAPLSSLLLTADQSDASTNLPNSGGSTSQFGLNELISPQAQQNSGIGMKLISTPSSVLQALGIDSALFTPQSQPDPADVSATADSSNATAASGNAVASADDCASVFQQFDAVTAADMAQTACIDQPEAVSIMAPDAPTTPAANQADFDSLSALGVGFQQDFHWLSDEFTS